MKPALRGRLLTPVLAAVLLAMSASVAVAEGFGDADPTRAEVCAAMACGDGPRVCGTAIGTSWKFLMVWDIPIVYPEEVSYTCYERHVE